MCRCRFVLFSVRYCLLCNTLGSPCAFSQPVSAPSTLLDSQFRARIIAWFWLEPLGPPSIAPKDQASLSSAARAASHLTEQLCTRDPPFWPEPASNIPIMSFSLLSLTSFSVEGNAVRAIPYAGWRGASPQTQPWGQGQRV
jgi:hypothetical protein